MLVIEPVAVWIEWKVAITEVTVGAKFVAHTVFGVGVVGVVVVVVVVYIV
jgi:hypothetical protein